MDWTTDRREEVAASITVQTSEEVFGLRHVDHTSDGEPLWDIDACVTVADLLAIAHALVEYERPGVSAIEVAEASRTGVVTEGAPDAD